MDIRVRPREEPDDDGRSTRRDLPALRPLDEEDILEEERARLGAPPPSSDAAPLALEDSDHGEAARPAAAGNRYCETCASWRKGRVCPVCLVDLETGDPVPNPTAEELGGPIVRDEQSGRLLLAEAPSHGQWLRAAVGQAVQSIPGGSICFILSWLSLTVRELPMGAHFPWPGRMLAGFTCTVWLVERARAARSRTADLDLIEIGGVLLRAAFLFPIFAGLAAGSWVALPVAVVLAPVFPLVLGALVTETPVKELGPRDLYEAWGATSGYFRTMLWFTITLGLAIAAVGWDEGTPLGRAIVAALGATIAGTLAGVARRSAEHVPEL